MERITATNPRTGRSSELVLTKRTEFCYDKNWSIEPKFALTVHHDARPSCELKFIEKVCSNPDAITEKWKRLKELGFPVVPTMRKLDYESILMTDLTQDGSKLFGKYRYRCVSGEHTDSVTQIFLSIPPENITSAVMKLAEDASENKIILAEDDPFEVLVHPDGTWQLVILDLTNVHANAGGHKEKLLGKNTFTVGMFLEMIEGIRKGIQKGDSQPGSQFDLDLI